LGCSYTALAVLDGFATGWAIAPGPTFLLRGVLEGTRLIANPLESVLVVTGVFAILLQGILKGTGLVANPLESVLAVTGALAILLRGVLAVTGILIVLLQVVLKVQRDFTTGRALTFEDLGDRVDSVDLGCHFQDGTVGMWCRSVVGDDAMSLCMYAKL
jgi:hypothetical protein